VDRAWRPRAGLTAGAAGPSGSKGTVPAGGWGAAAGTACDAGADGGSWTVVAASAPRPPQQVDAESAGKAQQGTGGLRSGWTVIGKKKGPGQQATAGPPGRGGAAGAASGGLQEGGVQSNSAPNLGTASQLGLADDAWEA